jgi:hypothetical protein
MAEHDRGFKSKLNNDDSLSVLEKTESRIEDAKSDQLTRSTHNSVASGFKQNDSFMKGDVGWEGDDAWPDEPGNSSSDTPNTRDESNESKNKSSKTSHSGEEINTFVLGRKIIFLIFINCRTQSIQSNTSSSIIFLSVEEIGDETSDSLSLPSYNDDTGMG